MELGKEDIKQLAGIAIEAAQKAGEVISSFVGRNLEVSQKPDKAQGVGASAASHVLTEVDMKCQEVILATLHSSMQKYDLAVLSEESVDDKSRLGKDYFWCIDPLDGTLPFIHSESGFSVSIALVNQVGNSILGVVFDPLTQTTYHAIKGKGAWQNGQQWTIRGEHNKVLTFVNDRSFLQQEKAPFILSQITSLAQAEGLTKLETLMHGGAAMNAIWVLENTPACYLKFPKQERGGGSLWDFAATACIVEEAGAHVTDMFGQPLNLNPHDTTFMNQKGVLVSSSHRFAEKITQHYASGGFE